MTANIILTIEGIDGIIIMGKKKVQIDYDIYNMLYNYFCGESPEDVDIRAIQAYLQDKQRKLTQHALFSASRNQNLPQDVRDSMRAQYEESTGVQRKFRKFPSE